MNSDDFNKTYDFRVKELSAATAFGAIDKLEEYHSNVYAFEYDNDRGCLKALLSSCPSTGWFLYVNEDRTGIVRAEFWGQGFGPLFIHEIDEVLLGCVKTVFGSRVDMWRDGLKRRK